MQFRDETSERESFRVMNQKQLTQNSKETQVSQQKGTQRTPWKSLMAGREWPEQENGRKIELLISKFHSGFFEPKGICEYYSSKLVRPVPKRLGLKVNVVFIRIH